MPQEPISNRENLRDGALSLLVLGLLGGVAAAFAADWAKAVTERTGNVESMNEPHETLAIVTLGVFDPPNGSPDVARPIYVEDPGLVFFDCGDRIRHTKHHGSLWRRFSLRARSKGCP